MFAGDYVFTILVILFVLFPINREDQEISQLLLPLSVELGRNVSTTFISLRLSNINYIRSFDWARLCMDLCGNIEINLAFGVGVQY